MQRVLIVIGVFALALITGAAAYFFFMGDGAKLEVTDGSVVFPGADTATPNILGGEEGGAPSAPTAPAQLTQVSVGPVVHGVVVTDLPAENASSSPKTLVHFIERQSGNVFSYDASLGGTTRTSNKTFPGIQNASWLPDGSRALVRFLSSDETPVVETYALPADGGDGFFLPRGLSDVSVSATGILALASGVNGSVATLSRIDGSRPAEVFSTPLSSLRASFAGRNQYLAVTKASKTLPGTAFIVSSAGRFSRVAGPLPGLSALQSPSGKWVLISYADGSGMSTALVEVATGALTELPLDTLVEKCAWTADDSLIYCGVPEAFDTSASYPDDWYQGAASFSDLLWKVDVAGRYAELVLDFPEEAEGVLDAIGLALNPAGTVLAFLNKNDGSLWVYRP